MEAIGDWLFVLTPLHWLAFAAVLIGIEMILPTQYLLWPGLAAAITAIILALVPGMDWPWQILTFAVLAIAATITAHYLPHAEDATAASLNQRTDQLVGRIAAVAEDFNHGQGPVIVGDTRWSAISADGSNPTAGASVEIVAAESTLLKVKPKP